MSTEFALSGRGDDGGGGGGGGGGGASAGGGPGTAERSDALGSADLDNLLFDLFHAWFGNVGHDLRIEKNGTTPSKMVDLGTNLWMAKNVDGKARRDAVDGELREKYAAALAALRLPPYMSGEALDFVPPEYLASAPPKLGAERVWAFGMLILLDQVTRNVHRGTAAAYSGDRSARRLVERLLPDFDAYAVPLRMSIILVYVHSEDMADLEVVQGLFSRVVDSPGGKLYAAVLAQLKGIIKNHADRQRLCVPRARPHTHNPARGALFHPPPYPPNPQPLCTRHPRFHRVPERNALLGRPSTEEELVYMKSFTA